MHVYEMRVLGFATILLTLMSCATTEESRAKVKAKTKQQITSEKATPELSYNLDDALSDLTTQIVSSMNEEDKKKSAVMDFSDLDGRVTEFGKYLAEELTTRLFMAKQSGVIERRLLNEVLVELKLSLTDIFEPNLAKELGQILGVDAIVSGTITDLGISLKVNARIISTETGAVFAVAAVEIPKDETVKRLIERVSIAGSSAFPESATEPAISKRTTKAGEIFFKEDFSEYEDRHSVPNWGEDLIVIKGRDGKKWLTSLVPGTHLTGEDVNFPENFKFEYTWTSYDDRASGHTAPYVRVLFELIDEREKVFRIECGNWGARLQGLRIVDFREGSINQFKLVKKGDVFTIYNNENFLQSEKYQGYSQFVAFRITIPTKANGRGQYFTNFIGTDLGD